MVELAQNDDPWLARYAAALGEAHIDNDEIAHDHEDLDEALVAFGHSVGPTRRGIHRARAG